ncbi:MAG: protein translocase subunit SecD [Lachnospiraceae bacterium]|nr:protein translocase subunit SecD [Lachnospiraceae bacterium]
MKKKRNNIIKLVVIFLIFVLGAYTVLFGIGGYGNASNIILGLDVRGGVSITYEVADEDFSAEDFQDTLSKLESRAQALSTEAEVYQEGDDRIVVNIPGETDAEATLEELGEPGTIEFFTYDDDGEEVVWLTGEDIQSASAGQTTEELTGEVDYVVELTMTSDGAEAFAQATTENVGEAIYIRYNDEVISSPTVQEAITGGEAQITGMESAEAAENLATMIRIGNLTLELNTISHKTVGARLGTDALEKSVTAGAIALVLICLFMIAVYRIPGIVAAFSLLFYTVLVLLALNGFNLTLTLPGIAGIILGIGMAGDANVIIYSRIREEIAAGETVGNAIQTGFHKANTAIIDGNVTTLIAAVILIWQGTGTVQGFAETLAVGILISMFTALVVSRIIVKALYQLGVVDPKYYGTEKPRKMLDVLGKRNIFLALSAVVIVACLAVGLMNRSNGNGLFNTSVEFAGGTSLTVDFEEDYSIDEFNETIKADIAEIIGSTDIQAQKETNSNTFTIKLQSIDESVMTEVKEMLVSDYGAVEGAFQESYVSATISGETTRSAVIATVMATICMLIYIWFRFSNIRYAFSAVLALCHDILVLIGFYMVSRTSVGTAFIACILPLVGYSINATIVIFDRIRENTRYNLEKKDFKTIINTSITQTMTRTIYTSLTTLVTVLIIFIMGVTAIQEFTLPIIVGVIVGGYSSVCITGSLLYLFGHKTMGLTGKQAEAQRKQQNKKNKAKGKKSRR